MRKLLFATAMCILAMGTGLAQVKDVKQAKSIANGTNPDFNKAEALIKGAMVNPDTKDMPETWDVAGFISKKYYDEEIKKAFLKTKYDTVRAYNSILNMFNYYNQCDKLAQIPNEKGKVKNKYRKANAATLISERPQLINGGVHFYNMGKNEEALKFFGTYVESANYDMLAESNIATTDTLLSQIAFYAVLAADRVGNQEAVIKYAPTAVNEPENGKFALQTLAEAYKAKADTIKFLELLNQGAEKFPAHDYFFANLVDIYTNKGQIENAMGVADKMIEVNPNNKLSLYIKAFLFHNMKKYDDAIEYYKKTIDVDPEYADAYSNIGLAYIMKAQDLAETMPSDMKDPKYKEINEKVRQMYDMARPFYEKARELEPEKQALWLQGLYRIYYNLNMEKEYAEIESLMK